MGDVRHVTGPKVKDSDFRSTGVKKEQSKTAKERPVPVFNGRKR